ncbi:tyrosine-type recombinase/integrase [Clostridium estertheticum]|uniref:tyrosine-type recombinase/integrase n=1 Tax=Clostridium estertheticum TaxID=238834 RepID=UPI001C0E34E8|nr:site-specific integrase [Clostridium estertheticum]MBU3187213.1 site-specific integrase [Clostridium estertheticum]
MIDNGYDSFISNFVNNRLLSEQTKKTYKYNLKRFCRWAASEELNVSNISELEIKKYVIYLTSKNISTFKQQIHIIERFMKFITGKEFNIKDVLNTIYVINEKPVNLLNTENVKELVYRGIERAEKDNNLRDEALLYTFLCTGLRVGEVEALNRIDLKENDPGAYLDVNVNNKVDRSSHSNRKFPIEMKCAECIKKYIKLRSDSDSAMFLSKNGQRLSIRGIQVILRKYGVSSHLLRRSFILDLVNKGVNAAEVASLMGHKSAETALKYLDPNKDYKYTAFKTLSKLYNKDK